MAEAEYPTGPWRIGQIGDFAPSSDSEVVAFCQFPDVFDSSRASVAFVSVADRDAPSPELSEVLAAGFTLRGETTGIEEVFQGVVLCDQVDVPVPGLRTIYLQSSAGGSRNYWQIGFTLQEYGTVWRLWRIANDPENLAIHNPGAEPWTQTEFLEADWVRQYYPELAQIAPRAIDYFDENIFIPLDQVSGLRLVDDGQVVTEATGGPPELALVESSFGDGTLGLNFSIPRAETIGIYTIEVTQTTVKGQDTMSWDLEIVAPDPPTVSDPDVFTVPQGDLYQQRFTVDGVDLTYELVDGPQTGETPARLQTNTLVWWRDSQAPVGSTHDFHYRVSNPGGVVDKQWTVEVVAP